MRVIFVDSRLFMQVLMFMVWQFGRALAHNKVPGLGALLLGAMGKLGFPSLSSRIPLPRFRWP